ncbi:MAG: 2-C-methyl-D-erythritol 4-phosphate cytidylyltransferase [Gemmatimonadota bacterium]
MRAAAVLPAGGAGLRMGSERRKQYARLAGEPIVVRAVRPFLEHPAVEWVVVALPEEDVAAPPVELPGAVIRVAGGAERGDSVRSGLDAVPEAAETVVIHDAARPLLTRELLDRVLGAVTPETGAIAALPVADTVKRVDDRRFITGTVDRTGLWRAQTPQAFPRTMIARAYARAAQDGVAASDDAALVERYGGRVVVVDGDPRNLKVTRTEDLALAELLLAAGP